ncbi:elongation of very long chain fatty acids protein 4 isoform X1 [Drosophila simulans]|uniref:elongation of very long chain fatty acids protein 4 isoform X1 n=1 Tax=Drosophila simulans TaxID=7240 RepID=UPI00192D0DCB|nr:elongation of very long chain fatty acids protein 4 isoform X1 [Drosophila simulans]
MIRKLSAIRIHSRIWRTNGRRTGHWSSRPGILSPCWPSIYLWCATRPNGQPGEIESKHLHSHFKPPLATRNLRYKPLQLRVPLFCHSLAMIFLNAYICLEFLTASLSLGYNFACQQMSHDPHEIRIAAAFWWFYISKILEFADTAFFILRHKWNQLSFLHVYHHSTMFLFCWIYVKWLPTGSIFFPSMINSFVHVIMYSYYALSVLGPRVQKFLWWKRYLTGLQLVQFTIILFWTLQLVYRGCEYGKWLAPIGAAYMVPFLFMFGRFYAQKYNVSAVIKKAK